MPSRAIAAPTDDRERLPSRGLGHVAVFPRPGLDQRDAEIETDADTLHRGAGCRHGRGLHEPARRAEHDRQGDRGRGDTSEPQQRQPGPISVPEGPRCDPDPSPNGPAKSNSAPRRACSARAASAAAIQPTLAARPPGRRPTRGGPLTVVRADIEQCVRRRRSLPCRPRRKMHLGSDDRRELDGVDLCAAANDGHVGGSVSRAGA
jgi:hypothetical protein